MKLCEIIKSDEYTVAYVDMQTDIKKITHLPEETDESTLLVIPNGKKISTLSNYARPRAILCSDDAPMPPDLPLIRAKNIRACIAYAFARFESIDFKGITMIGVTGTNGKTSTASFIERILLDNGYKVGFIGTGEIRINGKLETDTEYSMTTPDPWVLFKEIKKMQNAGCSAIVMEVSSHALALEKTAPIVFDYGVFTNISPEHLDFHNDIWEYFDVKTKLFQKCKKAVFNIDDSMIRAFSESYGKNKITAGVLWRGDVYASDVEDFGFRGSEYLFHGKNFLFKMKLKAPGIFNIYNSLMALCVCCDMGIAPCNAKRSLSEIKFIGGRYEIIKEDITVIIDYAHTSYAFECIMSNIYKAKSPKSKLITVFGCGGNRDISKRPEMARIAERYSDTVIVTSDNSRSEDPHKIISDIICGFSEDCFEIVEDRKEAIKKAILGAKDGSVVAIIGKGSERYNIDSNGYHYFNEKEIITAALAERRNKRSYANTT